VNELSIKARCIAGPCERRLHIKEAIYAAAKHGWPELSATAPHGGTVSIVASGPSVKGQLSKIKRHKKKGHLIFAIKGAQQWLLDNGVVPDLCLAVDPQTHIVSCFRTVHPDVTYLLGSQVHPWTFKHIHSRGGRIVLWHLYSKTNTDLLASRLQVGGGSTSGLRALTVSYMMGFMDMRLFGFDSCLSGEGEERARKITGETYGKDDKHRILHLNVAGKDYFTDPAFAAQADEFQKITQTLNDPKRGAARFRAYGEGLIQAICRDQQKNGNPQFWGVAGEGNNYIPAPVGAWAYVPKDIRGPLANPVDDVLRGPAAQVPASIS
jgi:uncharacterized Rossmann fold enzyme